MRLARQSDRHREPAYALAVSPAVANNPMKTSIVFALALGLALTGCSRSTHSNSTGNDTSTDYTASRNATANSANTDMNNAANDLRNAGSSAANAIGTAASNVSTSARMTEWHLNASDIQADLDSNKEIVRTKSATAGAPTASSDKSTIESMVKSRLEADSEIAALKFRVSADREGEVTLKGKAQSADQVGHAIALALDTEGVSKVTSKIKLDSDAKTNR